MRAEARLAGSAPARLTVRARARPPPMNRTSAPRTLLLAVSLSAGLSAGAAPAQAAPAARPLLRPRAAALAPAQPLQRADGRPANGNIGQRGRAPGRAAAAATAPASPSAPAPVAAAAPAPSALASGAGVTGPLLGRGERPACGNIVTKGGRTVECRDGAGRLTSSTSYRGSRVVARDLYVAGVLTASVQLHGDRVVASCATPPLPGRRWLVCRDEAGQLTSRTSVDAEGAGVTEQHQGGRLRSVMRTGPLGIVSEIVEYDDAGQVIRRFQPDASGNLVEVPAPAATGAAS